MAHIRTGRATVSLLDGIHVEAYGTRDAHQPGRHALGARAGADRRAAVRPIGDGAIEKAIRASDLGLNPANDGKVVRIPIPSLTDDRRKELSRHVHKQAEEGRNVVRQVRRDANDRLKKLLKDHTISEDDERKGLDQVQKTTDEHVKLIDELQKKKPICSEVMPAVHDYQLTFDSLSRRTTSQRGPSAAGRSRAARS